MEYTQEQIDAVIKVTGPHLFVNHVLGVHSDAVHTGMQLSVDGDGLRQEDIEAIESLM
jgi:hypothetical protein